LKFAGADEQRPPKQTKKMEKRARNEKQIVITKRNLGKGGESRPDAIKRKGRNSKKKKRETGWRRCFHVLGGGLEQSKSWTAPRKSTGVVGGHACQKLRGSDTNQGEPNLMGASPGVVRGENLKREDEVGAWKAPKKQNQLVEVGGCTKLQNSSRRKGCNSLLKILTGGQKRLKKRQKTSGEGEKSGSSRKKRNAKAAL